MADELNIPTHRWYEPRNNISLPNSDFSKQWIYDSGIQKIDRWINSQPWGNPIPGLFSGTAIGIWLDPSDVANLSWRRNLLTYSEQFDNAIWTKSNAAVLASVTDPVGGNSADTITATANSAHILQQISVAAGQSMVPSVWIRRRTGTGAINMWNAAGSTVNITSSVSSSWSRVTVPSVIAGSSPFFFLQIATSGDAVDLWGAQLELGTSATDYQRISDVNTEVIERFPNATMYQDAAGTTPVTTPGQPVGLRLDKSKGLALGAELVANGTFDTNTTGWSTFGVSASVSSGQVAVTVTGAYGTLSQSFATVVGRTYKVTGNIVGVTAGSPAFYGIRKTDAADPGSNIVEIRTSVGAGSGVFVATATTSFVVLQVNTTSAVVVFDNISVRELPGNHATQSVLASRPVYGIEPAGGRRNLLTWSEDFANPIWVGSPTLTANAAVAPDGTTTADLITAGGMYRSYGPVLGTSYTVTVYAKPFGAASTMRMIGGNGFSPRGDATFNLTTGTLSSGTGTITPVGNGWYRLNVQMTYATANDANIYWDTFGTGAYLWGGQAELGSTATAYQRTTTAFDVTEAGVQSCHYVQYDGSDDGMITNSIDFTATDKMSVFAGVRKLSDAAVNIIAELSPTPGTNPGSFSFNTGTSSGTGPNYAAASRGSASFSGTQFAVSAASFTAPITNIVTNLHDISGDLSAMRVNGAASGTNGTGDQGTGNFGNYPLFLGRRNNGATSPNFPLNGRDYGIVVVGKATTADEITSTERWLSGKTGFYAPIITGVPTIGVS